MRGFEFAIFSGDWVTVRVVAWKSEKLVEFINERFRLNVFQLFCYIVYLVPGKFEFLIKECLPKPVFSDSFKSDLASFFSELNPFVLLVFQQFFVRKPLDHIGQDRKSTRLNSSHVSE